MSDKVYVITSGDYSDYRIVRVYLDRDEAERFKAAVNATKPSDEHRLEEYDVGAPQVEYDGPFWTAWWQQTPAATTWPLEERTHVYEGWWAGAPLPRSEVYERIAEGDYPRVCVRGMSKEHVEKSLHDAVAQVKAEWAGLT